MNNRKNLDEIFKEGIGSYSEKPAKLVWEKLENRLIQEQSKNSSMNIKILPFLLIGIIIITSYFYISNNNINETIIENNSLVKEPTTKYISPSNSHPIEHKTNNSKNSKISNNNNSSNPPLNQSTTKALDKDATPPKINFEKETKSFDQSVNQAYNKLPKESENKYQIETKNNRLTEDIDNQQHHKSKIAPKAEILNDLSNKTNNELDLSIKKDITILDKNSKTIDIQSIALLSSYLIVKENDLELFALIEPVHRKIKNSLFSINLEKSLLSTGFRTLKDNNQQTNEHIDYFNSVEENGQFSSIALTLLYESPSFGFETGIEFFNQSITGTQEFFSTYLPNDFSSAFYITSFNRNSLSILPSNLSGLETGDLISFNNKVLQSHKGISIPFYVFKKLKLGSFQLSTGLGTTMNIPLSNTVELLDIGGTNTINQYRIDDKEENAQIYFGYSGKIRLAYPLSKSFQLTTSLVHNRSISSANKNKLVNYYPYHTRMLVGIQKTF